MAGRSVAAVVVSWNVRPLLRDCLASLREASNQLPVQTWVVDNGSTDGSVDMVRAEFPEVLLIVNPGNPGFAAANNQGILAGASDDVLLLNPDAVLQPGALEALVACLAAHSDVAVCGPRLLNPDGSVQPSRRRAPRLATGFVESTQLQQWWPRWWLTDRYYVADRPDDLPQRVDWLVGACLLVRRDAIARVGLLDEGYHLYSEEVDWCLRFRRAGWQVAYVPEAGVLHYGGQSSGQDVLRRHLHHHRSKYRLYRGLFGASASGLLRAWIGGLYLLQLVEELLKLALLPRNRGGRRRRLRVLAHMALWHVVGDLALPE